MQTLQLKHGSLSRDGMTARVVGLLFVYALLTCGTLDHVAAAISLEQVEPRKRLALVIGNANYQTQGALRNPINDANGISEALRRLGFAVTLHRDMSYPDMKRALMSFRKKIGYLDTVVFFYSGFGINYSGADYIVPVDVEHADSAETLLSQSIPLAYVTETLNQSKGTKIFLIDGSRSNPFASSRGLARISDPNGSLMFFSSEEGTVAMDGRGENSPFTRALLKYIEQPGLEINEFVQLVSQDVSKATNDAQRPQWVSSLTTNFYFSPDPNGMAAATTKETYANTKPVNQKPSSNVDLSPVTTLDELKAQRERQLLLLDKQERLWRHVKDTKFKEDLELFLKKFPDGLYTDLAKLRLDRLNRGKKVTLKPKPVDPNQAAISWPISPPDRRVALIIGNSSYENERRLKNPEKDARTVAEALVKLGFKVEEVRLNQKKSEMEDALRIFARKVRTADLALIYFSGHGMEVNGTNYLIPTDAKLDTDTDVAFEAIPLDLVLGTVRRARKLRVVLLDACRDNPFLQTMKLESGATKNVSKGFQPIREEADLLVNYAAAAGTTASDGEGQNSPYARALVQHLLTPGKDISRVFGLIRDSVSDMTDGRQVPHTYGSLSGKEYYLVPPKT